MANNKLVAFHIFALCESIFALSVYHYYIDSFRTRTYGGHWKFLTYINMQVQLFCFLMCIACDILEWLNYHNFVKKFRQIKDGVYASIGVPSCLAVFVTFWVLFLIDRELVYPKRLDKYLPVWANHVWHSAILITLVEVICDHHSYPRRSLGLSLCSIFGVGYIFWLDWVHKESGIAVYPFLKTLEGMWYVLFIVTEIFFSWLTYLLGEYLNSRVGVTSQTKQKKKQ